MAIKPKAACTDEELIELLKKHVTIRKVADVLGVHHSSITRRKAVLVKRGFSPPHHMTHTVPQGYAVKGVSSYFDRDGNLAGQWVKSREDAAQQEALMRAFVAALGEDVKGHAAPVPRPQKRWAPGSTSAYLIGDAHFGLYAWGAETGADFNTDIADQDLRAAIDNLVQSAPSSETGLLVNVGDFLHANDNSGATPQNGNRLDVDTRYQRVIRIATLALRYCVQRMLEKHDRVKLVIVPGNHDPDAAGWLALTLAMFYESEPRVEVDQTPGKTFYHKFGRVLIGMTHGDKVKMDQLPSIMAADRSEEWGYAKHRYWFTGHIHTTRQYEFRGCFVESFNTLAPKDAWHTEQGYRSERQMQRIDFDPVHGIYARAICTIGMIR